MNQKSTLCMESKISLMGTFQFTLGHAQGSLLLIVQNSFNADSVNKTTSLSFTATPCTIQTAVQCLCNFSSTQALNKPISCHYAHHWKAILNSFFNMHVHVHMLTVQYRMKYFILHEKFNKYSMVADGSYKYGQWNVFLIFNNNCVT